MKFNLVHGNHSHQGLHIADTLRLIKYSLESIGHLVAFSPQMKEGEVNILIECFTYDFIVAMEQVSKSPGTKFILVATEYISSVERFNHFPELHSSDSHYGNDAYWIKRWKTFCLATDLSDVIWCLSEEQVPAYQKRFSDLSVGSLSHGYIKDFNKVSNRKASQKDIDVLFTGTVTPYRQKIINGLKESGLNIMVGSVFTPDHQREDWISRSKLAINLKQNHNWLYPSNSRFFYHVMNYSLLVTEKCQEMGDLDDFVLHAEPSQFIHFVQDTLALDTSELAQEKYNLFKEQRPIEPIISKLVDETINF